MADQAVAHITVTESCSVIAFSDVYYTAFETPVDEPAPGFVGNDTVECQPFSTSVSVNPTNGTVTAGADGAFVYTPNPGFYFSDEFTYEILDANQVLMATSVVTVVVDKPPCIAVDDAYTTAVDTPLAVAAPGVLGNDQVCPDASLFQVDQPPAFGTATLQPDGSFQYVPDSGFVGQDSFTYDHLKFDSIVLDYVSLATATVVIDVTETPATTTTTLPPASSTTNVPSTDGYDVDDAPGDTTTTTPRSPRRRPLHNLARRRRPSRVPARRRHPPRRPRPGSVSPRSTPR